MPAGTFSIQVSVEILGKLHVKTPFEMRSAPKLNIMGQFRGSFCLVDMFAFHSTSLEILAKFHEESPVSIEKVI